MDNSPWQNSWERARMILFAIRFHDDCAAVIRALKDGREDLGYIPKEELALFQELSRPFYESFQRAKEAVPQGSLIPMTDENMRDLLKMSSCPCPNMAREGALLRDIELNRKMESEFLSPVVPPRCYRDQAGVVRVHDEGLQYLIKLAHRKVREVLAKKGAINTAVNIAIRALSPVAIPYIREVLTKEQEEMLQRGIRALNAILRPEAPSDAEILGKPEYTKEIYGLLAPERFHPVIASPVTREILPAMSVPSLWEEAEGFGLCYARNTKRVELRYVIAGKDPRSGMVQAIPGKEAIEIVKNLGLETALLHIHFCAGCFRSDKPWVGVGQTNADRLIDLLQLSEKRILGEDGKRRALTRQEQLAEVVKALESLKAIHVCFRMQDRRGFIIENREMAPLWDLSILDVKQPQLFEDGEILTDLIVAVRAGNWAMYEANREAFKKEEGYFLTGKVSDRVKEFDRFREEWALTWALFLSQYPAQRPRNRITVRELLEQVLPGGKDELLSLTRPDKRQARYDCATRLVEQLDAMKAKGWIILESKQFSIIRAPRRPRDYFPLWLESTVKISSPPEDGIEGKGEEPQLLLQNGAGIPTGEQIAEARKSAGITQRGLARIMEKSPAWVSRIEKGDRRISQADLKRLKKYLAL